MAKRKLPSTKPLDLEYTPGIPTPKYIPIHLLGLLSTDREYQDTLHNLHYMHMKRVDSSDELIDKYIRMLLNTAINNPELLATTSIYDNNIKKIMEGNANYYNFIYGVINNLIFIGNIEEYVYTYYLDTGIDGIDADTIRIYIVRDYIKEHNINNCKGKIIYCDLLTNLNINVIIYLQNMFKLFNRKYDYYTMYNSLSERDIFQIREVIDNCY